jgi:hypothetical protein
MLTDTLDILPRHDRRDEDKGHQDEKDSHRARRVPYFAAFRAANVFSSGRSASASRQ